MVIPGQVFHISRRQNVQKIRKSGLIPGAPEEGDVSGVYFFTSMEDAEDALANWLGERFDEDEELVVLVVDATQLDPSRWEQDVGYELRYLDAVPPSAIVSIRPIS